MGRHRRNDNNGSRQGRLSVARKVVEFDAEAARLDAKYAKKREQMGSVEQATADAEMKSRSWGRRKK